MADNKIYSRNYYHKYKHTDKYLATQALRRKRRVAKLYDSYIKHQLKNRGFTSVQITPELITLKRVQIQLKRNIKAKRQQEQEMQASQEPQDFTELEQFLVSYNSS